MHKGIQEPHVLLASSNVHKMVRNLTGVLGTQSLNRVRGEIRRNVKKLFELGEGHYTFAVTILPGDWRQRISRLYYASYNCRRAVMLEHNGNFSTDSSDHKNVHDLPDALPNVVKYRIALANLREDRNLADYSHEAAEVDLVIPVVDALTLTNEFIRDARIFLHNKGVQV